jgi:hypothetical protein
LLDENAITNPEELPLFRCKDKQALYFRDGICQFTLDKIISDGGSFGEIATRDKVKQRTASVFVDTPFVVLFSLCNKEYSEIFEDTVNADKIKVAYFLLLIYRNRQRYSGSNSHHCGLKVLKTFFMTLN